MERDRIDGWWSIPPLTHWVCPRCEKESPVDDWEESSVGCEDCGEHDARVCPLCGEASDHVWGTERILEAIEEFKSKKVKA